MSDRQTRIDPARAGGTRADEPLVLRDDDPEALEALVEEFEAEKPARKLEGLPKQVVALLGFALSGYAIYWVLRPIPAQIYRTSFLAIALAMTFLVYRGWGTRRSARPGQEWPSGTSETSATSETGEADGTRPAEGAERPRTAPAAAARRPDNPGITDWLLAVLSVVALGYTLVAFDEFVRRAVVPTTLDITFGVITTLLVLEATRRTVGWILPAICIAFLAYANLGGYIPAALPFSHIGYDVDRLVGQTYMGLEGIFGVPLDVAATYIVLFTIYGAVLEYSGAGKYFIDISFAAFGKSQTGAGRTTTVAGFLLGTVSGSGTATTVTLGSVAWPILKRAGYPPNEGGGVLAAAGIGAILSPPTLGAAAFIIAEFLGESYLKVLVYAMVPSLLYYLGILLAIAADARKFNTVQVHVETPPARRLLLRYGYHFSSLFLIVILMALGYSPFRAVFYATIAAFLLSFLDPKHAMTPRRVWSALVAGAMGVIPVAATTAAAGIIVAVVTLTGLGLKLSTLIVGAAGGSLLLTTVFAAVAVLLLGLAVPVTASFIISSVVIGPALTGLGVPQYVAYMFIFYYAVLSEVSPPTALSAVAASAVTGGNAFRTMMMTWKYTLPAFLVPFAFVLSPNGQGVLLQGSVATIALTVAISALGVAALTVLTAGWLKGPAAWPERTLAGVAALFLLDLEPLWAIAGIAVFALAVGVHFLGLRRAHPTTA